MKRLNGAMLLAFATCALTSMTFGVLRVDELSEKTDDVRVYASKIVIPKERIPLTQKKSAHPTAVLQIPSDKKTGMEPGGGEFESAGNLLLLNYLHQFNPSTQSEVDTILQVAQDARTQLSAHQVEASQQLQQIRSRLDEVIGKTNAMPQRDPQMASPEIVFDQYLGLMEERAFLSKKIALQQETLAALEVENASEHMKAAALGFSFEDEKRTLQKLQADISIMDGNLRTLDARISNYWTEAPSDLNSEIQMLLEKYKAELDTTVDQDVIIERFDSILAAAQYVDFKER